MTDDSREPSGAETSGEAELGVEPGEKLCGNCRWYRPLIQESGVWKGNCRMMPNRGMFPPSAPLCNHFLSKERPLPKKLEPLEVVRRRAPAPVRILRAAESETMAAADRLDEETGEFEMTRAELLQVLQEAMGTSEVALAPKWEGGTLLLKPGNPELAAKEIPIDSLFHKVVMVRDRLRVIEQKINAHPKLSDAEKVEMQQYITKIYGSLTTFNVLFRDKADNFVGDKGAD